MTTTGTGAPAPSSPDTPDTVETGTGRRRV